jgi:ADP-ribose pyrophosphatase YjhB (NUDIX family)
MGEMRMGYIEDIRRLVGHRPLILVGCVVVIADERGRLLLQERVYPKGTWGLAGGLMELGERAEETAVREVREETGLEVENLKMINVYSGPDHFAVAENGDEFYMVTCAYYTRCYKGELKADLTESAQIRFFEPDSLPCQMVRSHRMILEEYLTKHHKNG